MITLEILLMAASLQAGDPLVVAMQRVELSRNTAIKAGDMAALDKLYSKDFTGIAGNGSRVDRATLFAVFKRNAGGNFKADSKILSARDLGKGLVAVEGRLTLSSELGGQPISDSHYLHIFRRNGDHWEMIEGAAVPITQPSH